eukprot:56003_1
MPHSEFSVSVIIIDMCIASLILISTLIIVYKYIHHYLTIDEKPDKPFFYSALILSICTILSLIITIIIAILKYLQIDSLHYISLLFFILYDLEHYCFAIALFINLYYIFHESIIRISSTTTRLFLGIFAIQLFLILFIAAFESIFRGTILWYIIFGLNHTFLIFMSLALVILYIYKLVIVYTQYNNDFNLIQIITKTCILALTSIIFSLITVSFIVYKYGTDTDVFYMHSITNILTSFDISTNFLTVMLCMKYFDKYYHKLCGICIHKQCESCWYYIMDKSLKKQKHETESSIDSPKQTPSDNVSGSTPDIQDKNPKLTLQEQTLSLSIISSIKSATKTHHSCMSPIAENTETDSSKKTFKMSKSLKKTKSNNSGLKLPSAIIPSLKLKNTLSLSLMQASTPNNEIQAHDQITPDDDMHLAGTVYLAE